MTMMSMVLGVTSTNPQPALPRLPVNRIAATITGTPRVGEFLYCSPGVWVLNTQNFFTFRWYRGPTLVSTENQGVYKLVEADSGFNMTCQVSTTSRLGEGTTLTGSTAAVLPGPPASLTAPVVTGTVKQGSTLTCSTGTWSGSPTVYQYYWIRGAGTFISGANSSTYVPTADDLGSKISCLVLATGPGGSGNISSNQVGPILTATPTNTVAPVVTGTPQEGSTLSSTTGTWDGSPTGYTYQWCRYGDPIANATSSTYVPASYDAGYYISCKVTATNAFGASAPVESNSVGSISPRPAPTSKTAPVVTGNNFRSSTLTTTNGTWDGSPTQYLYNWYRGSTAISGAISSTYKLVGTDIGFKIKCGVTAVNEVGSGFAYSNEIGPVIDTP